jgi:hypothetical protein
MQPTISSWMWLAALCFAPLAIVATAVILFLWSKKPHYRSLYRRWGRAAVGSAVIGVVLALSSLPDLDFGARISAASARVARGFCSAVGAVGLAAAGVYAWELLRCLDDYYARSGLRIAASVGVAGLIVQLLVRDPNVMMLGVALLIVAAGLLAARWLWHVYPREPPWLLRTCVLALPAAAAIIVWFNAGGWVAVGAVLCAAGAILLLGLARRAAVTSRGASRHAV